MGKFLFDRGDAAGITAADDAGYFSRQGQGFLFHNLVVADDVDCDVVVDVAENL